MEDTEIHYEFFGQDGRRRSVVHTWKDAGRIIGERVLIGFEMHQRHVRTPSGQYVQVTYFQSDITGHVWGLYYY